MRRLVGQGFDSPQVHVSDEEERQRREKELDEAARKFERTLGDSKGGK